MRFKITRNIIVNEQKLELLLRLGCNNDVIFAVICGKKVAKTGDKIIDELLESLVSKKEHQNWGGARKSAGRKRNQLEKQNDRQDGSQDDPNLEAKAIAKANNISGIYTSNISTARVTEFIPPTLDEVLAYAKQQTELAGVGGFPCAPYVAEQFWAHYQSQGWRKSNDAETPVRDWRAALRMWARGAGPGRNAAPPPLVNNDDLPV